MRRGPREIFKLPCCKRGHAIRVVAKDVGHVVAACKHIRKIMPQTRIKLRKGIISPWQCRSAHLEHRCHDPSQGGGGEDVDHHCLQRRPAARSQQEIMVHEAKRRVVGACLRSCQSACHYRNPDAKECIGCDDGIHCAENQFKCWFGCSENWPNPERCHESTHGPGAVYAANADCERSGHGYFAEVDAFSIPGKRRRANGEADVVAIVVPPLKPDVNNSKQVKF